MVVLWGLHASADKRVAAMDPGILWWLLWRSREVPGGTGRLLWGFLRGEGGPMWVGVGPILESGARARANFFIFSFYWYGTHHTIQKKRKSDSRDSGCARGPQLQNHPLFFFARSWCMPWGYALLSPAQLSPARLSSAQPSSAQPSPAQPSQHL